MSDKTLTRADLVESVVESVGLPRHEAAELVETVLQELSTTLASGEPVKLSSFGSFGIREKRQRIGRNPKTGQEVPITPRRVLVFRASNIMKKRIDETIKAANGKRKPKAKTKTPVRAKAKTAAKPAAKSKPPAKAKATTKAKSTAKAKSAVKAKATTKANSTAKSSASTSRNKLKATGKPSTKKASRPAKGKKKATSGAKSSSK